MLMISKIPMRKMHAAAVPPTWAAPLLAILAICAAAAVLAPYVLIWVIIIAYLCHVPFAIRNQRWLAAHPEVWGEKPEQRRAVRRANRREHPGRRPIPRLGLGKPRGRSMTRLGLRKPGGRLP
jgi:CDP-diacylglycerol--serine O-phosphatidyltransferase